MITSTNYLKPEILTQFIDQALAEDVGSGDHSSIGAVPENTVAKAFLKIKEEGIVAGMELAKLIFNRVDPQLNFHPLKEDGVAIYQGDVAFEVNGNARSILTAERLVLTTSNVLHEFAIAAVFVNTEVVNTGKPTVFVK